MNKQINNTFQVLCLMQVALEKLEDMPEGNIFRENNGLQLTDASLSSMYVRLVVVNCC